MNTVGKVYASLKRIHDTHFFLERKIKVTTKKGRTSTRNQQQQKRRIHFVIHRHELKMKKRHCDEIISHMYEYI
jgi:hypothetical protein